MIRPGIRRLFRLAVRRWRGIPAIARDDVDTELDSHIALRTDALVREGWDADDARREALRRFGSLDDARHGLRAARVTQERSMHIREWVTDLSSDIRYAVRALVREPSFSVFAVVTLALGIGVNAAMFSVVDRLLLSGPAHVRDPNGVMRLQSAYQPAGRPVQQSGRFGYVAYDVLHRGTQSFDAIAAYQVTPEGALLGRGVDARRINRGEATAGFFPLLGVQPALGRFFDEREDDVVAPAYVVVLGYALWQREFGGQRDVIGKSLTLDNRDFTIVGVAPNGFTGPDLTRVDAWIPESVAGRTKSPPWSANWSSWWLHIVARLKPEVAAARAGDDATAAHRAGYGGRDSVRRASVLSLKPLRYTPDGIESVEARVSTWLLAVAACVLLIACANVINLQLARALRRQREIAVRVTLGAGRARLVRMMVTEAMALAAVGGVMSIGVAIALGALVRSRLIPSVDWTTTLVDGRTVAAAAIITVVVGLVVGVVPALRASAPDLASAMKAGVREGGGRTGRLRATLTVAQAALSVVLLVGAGLFVQSLRQIRALDLGVEPDRVVAFGLTRAGASIADTAERRREVQRRAAFLPDVLEAIRRRPDVERATLSIGIPLGGNMSVDIRVPGRDSIPIMPGGDPSITAVGSDYFETVGGRLVDGRTFTADDRRGSPAVAIVNETMATTLWPGEAAIGKCFYVGSAPACARIVGVAANTRRFGLREQPGMSYYIPLGQEIEISFARLLVRPRGDPAPVVNEIRKQLVALDPSIIYVRGDLLQTFVDPQVRPWRLGATMFTLMGVLALIVAAVGLYSVMSYLVANRTREIGVRIALGAQTRDVVQLVVRSGATLAVVGVGIGLVIAAVVSGRIESLLFDTSPRDPVVFATVAVVLLLSALVASALPAVRAGRVSPMEAMRE